MVGLAFFRLTAILMYYSVIGYPVIIMMIKACKWEKENGRNIRLRVYNFIFFILLIQSSFWERSLVTSNYMFFAIIPLLLLFSYQKKDYEPDFTWTRYLGNHKALIVIFFVLLIAQWPMSRVIAGELLNSHHDWVENSLEVNRDFTSNNEYGLSTYEGEIHKYLMNYDQDTVMLNRYSGTQISFKDEYMNFTVWINYHLVGARWELVSINLTELLK